MDLLATTAPKNAVNNTMITKITAAGLNSGTVGLGDPDALGLAEADAVGLGDAEVVGPGDVYVIEESDITDTVVLSAFDTKISFVPES